MFIELNKNQALYCQDGLWRAIEVLPDKTLRVCYLRPDIPPIWLGSSLSDFIREVGLVQFLASNGVGLTSGEALCTAANREPPTAKPSDGPPSSSEKEYSPISSVGGGGTKIFRTSSTMKESRLENSGALGQLRAGFREYDLPRTTCDGHGPQSLCRED